MVLLQPQKRLLPAWTSLSQGSIVPFTNICVVGSDLRIGIVHARWNAKMIDALLAGARKSLKEAGVKDENIVLQTVPGSYELPFAVQRYDIASLPRRSRIT